MCLIIILVLSERIQASSFYHFGVKCELDVFVMDFMRLTHSSCYCWLNAERLSGLDPITHLHSVCVWCSGGSVSLLVIEKWNAGCTGFVTSNWERALISRERERWGDGAEKRNEGVSDLAGVETDQVGDWNGQIWWRIERRLHFFSAGLKCFWVILRNRRNLRRKSYCKASVF